MPSPSEALKTFSAVVVTGGSSGIGKSFIRLCSTLKPDLLFCNLSRRAPGENIFSNPGQKLNHFSCDLAISADVERAAAGLTELLARDAGAGRILLLNNSGFGSFGPFAEQNLARELEMLDVNIRGLVHLTGRLLPLLRARGGAILNVASTVAYQPTPYAATYGATKAFVLHWTLALREELRDAGVSALAVCPGTTATEFFATAGAGEAAAQTSLVHTPEQVAAAALRALAGGRGQVVPGFWNKVYTFLGARVPKGVAARAAGNVFARRGGRGTPA